MRIILLKAFMGLLILGACVSDKLLKLASEYTGSIVFYEQAQKKLRLVYSQCEYKTECFQEDGMKHIKEDFCPRFKEYKFVSETECHRAGQGVLDLVSGKTHIAVPVNNPTQNAHNEQMLEVEKERLELEKRRDEREERKEEIAEERREDADDQCHRESERCGVRCCERECQGTFDNCSENCDAVQERCEDQCGGDSGCDDQCTNEAGRCVDQCDAVSVRCEDQCETNPLGDYSCVQRCRRTFASCISAARR